MILHYQNNWEADIYTVGGKLLRTLESVEIGGVEYAVTHREVRIQYHDMGHQYTAQSTHYFINAMVFGKMHEFDLNSVKVPITPLQYTVEDRK